MRLGPKEKEVLKLLSQGPKSASEIYLHFGATEENEKRAIRAVILRLKRKGLVQRLWNTQLYALTEKGKAALKLLEE